MKSPTVARDHDERGHAALALVIAIAAACIRRDVATRQVADAWR